MFFSPLHVQENTQSKNSTFLGFDNLAYLFRPNCTYVEMWDMEDPANLKNPSLCDIFGAALGKREFNKLKPFKIVYTSSAYIVLQLT